MRLEGKSALVTGAGSGIGRATCLLLASEGAKVLATDVTDGVEATADLHASIEAMKADAGSETDVADMVSETNKRFGAVDVVVANAGVSGGLAGIFDQDASDWENILRINLTGPFLAIKYGAKAMVDAKQPGSIVCTASVAGLRAGAGGPAYSASKAGVINLVQTAAQQLYGTGIRVNAVCPGLIKTGMTEFAFDAARQAGKEDRIGALNPMARHGVSKEIAAGIAYLASDESSYVNGHALVIDGGLASSHPFAKPPQLGKIFG